MTENKLSEKEMQEIREDILSVLKDCQYDFDYGYSKEVGVLNVRMVDRNKVSYKLLDLFDTALTRERERVRPVIDALDWALSTIEASHEYVNLQDNSVVDQCQFARETLSNYQKTKAP